MTIHQTSSIKQRNKTIFDNVNMIPLLWITGHCKHCEAFTANVDQKYICSILEPVHSTILRYFTRWSSASWGTFVLLSIRDVIFKVAIIINLSPHSSLGLGSGCFTSSGGAVRISGSSSGVLSPTMYIQEFSLMQWYHDDVLTWKGASLSV